MRERDAVIGQEIPGFAPFHHFSVIFAFGWQNCFLPAFLLFAFVTTETVTVILTLIL
jgi:hypothetical protein